MADLDPERALVLAYVPASARPALAALWQLDAECGAVLATGTEPMVTRIRLAWWREALERLDREAPPPQPLLQTIAAHVLPAGVTGAELSRITEGWDAIVGAAAPEAEALNLYAAERGARLFRLSARLLGGDAHVEPSGEAWALIDLARHSADRDEAYAAMMAAAVRKRDKSRWPRTLRPLGMLASLIDRDLRKSYPERQGRPSRIARMICYRLMGS